MLNDILQLSSAPYMAHWLMLKNVLNTLELQNRLQCVLLRDISAILCDSDEFRTYKNV